MVPIFKGEKYHLWSLKMKTLFRSQESWDLVENGFEDANPAEPDQRLRENRKKDAKKLFLIRSALDESHKFMMKLGVRTRKVCGDRRVWFRGNPSLTLVVVEKAKYFVCSVRTRNVCGDRRESLVKMVRVDEKSEDKAFQVKGEPHRSGRFGRQAFGGGKPSGSGHGIYGRGKTCRRGMWEQGSAVLTNDTRNQVGSVVCRMVKKELGEKVLGEALEEVVIRVGTANASKIKAGEALGDWWPEIDKNCAGKISTSRKRKSFGFVETSGWCWHKSCNGQMSEKDLENNVMGIPKVVQGLDRKDQRGAWSKGM